jgi:hypothetical protein
MSKIGNIANGVNQVAREVFVAGMRQPADGRFGDLAVTLDIYGNVDAFASGTRTGQSAICTLELRRSRAVLVGIYRLSEASLTPRDIGDDLEAAMSEVRQ